MSNHTIDDVVCVLRTGFPKWPAVIRSPQQVLRETQVKGHQECTQQWVLVELFGQKQYAWVIPSNLEALTRQRIERWMMKPLNNTALLSAYEGALFHIEHQEKTRDAELANEEEEQEVIAYLEREADAEEENEVALALDITRK
ncbi:hypothetical protein PM082_022982 [Marasmius tenuissimus]|nr:hypothetical protein PM082_022982 [Marasmius tenuissimus]